MNNKYAEHASHLWTSHEGKNPQAEQERKGIRISQLARMPDSLLSLLDFTLLDENVVLDKRK